MCIIYLNLTAHLSALHVDVVCTLQVQSLVEAGAWLSWGSIQKISWCLLAISLLSYAAVSPSTLPLTEYNLQFYENLRIVCLSTIAPAMYMLLVFDPRENDVNLVTNIFVVTFFFGYIGIYILELVATTAVRLLLFIWLEPNVFSLMPRIPLPVLPWVLRECQYRPKRVTLFAADFATSCIACPIIEEYIKFFLLQRTSKLPRYVLSFGGHSTDQYSHLIQLSFFDKFQQFPLGRNVKWQTKDKKTSRRNCKTGSR